ncbi:MAG: phosphatidylglycerol---prolipoprotein diacylglyceryl transferase [Clostridia bacterium]|nr:phosphatidylglycerol---prolipoprotein diacylglyceryl transferase [Clostridia bacterium]
MINPIAFEIGPIQVRWYGILMSTALLVGTFLALREVIKRQGIDEDKFMNILIAAIPAGFIGARLYYVIFRWDYYSKYPSEIPAVWHGGLAIHGGIIGAFTAGLLMIRYYNMNFWRLGDIVAPSLIIGQAIGRWGNFINQEAYGYEVDPEKVPWAMWIDGAYRHPTFLYESIWNFLGFLLLIWLRRQRFIKKGEVHLSYFIYYSLGRFVVEGFRTDSLMLGPLRAAQVISIVFILISIFIIWYRRKKNKDKIFI